MALSMGVAVNIPLIQAYLQLRSTRQEDAPSTSCRYAGKQSSMFVRTMAPTLRGWFALSVSEIALVPYLQQRPRIESNVR